VFPRLKSLCACCADHIDGEAIARHGGRLAENETYCSSCFGAEMSDDQCCNSCEEVREAYGLKGWAVTDPKIIDQVLYSSASGN
jgi:hypothetical protein